MMCSLPGSRGWGKISTKEHLEDLADVVKHVYNDIDSNRFVKFLGAFAAFWAYEGMVTYQRAIDANDVMNDFFMKK